MRNLEKNRAACRKYYAEHRAEILAHKVAVSRKYYAAHREEILAQKKAQHAANPDARKEYHRTYNQANKHRARDRSLQKLYGITHAQYLKILRGQGGVCAVCMTDNWGKREPFIDHNHSTGQIRGILCQRCNTAIGYAGDSPEILEALAAYLRINARIAALNSRATEPQPNTPGEAVNAG